MAGPFPTDPSPGKLQDRKLVIGELLAVAVANGETNTDACEDQTDPREQLAAAPCKCRGLGAVKIVPNRPMVENCELMALNAVVMPLSSAGPVRAGKFEHAGPDSRSRRRALLA